MHYVYILRAVNFPEQIYIGCTKNLKKRISDHNCGHSSHTSKYKPWKMIVVIAFANENAAFAFEKYLKSGSGSVFVKKRFLQEC